MNTKFKSVPPRLLTLREKIREMEKTLREAQDSYVSECLAKGTKHTLRDLTCLVNDAKRIDINSEGARGMLSRDGSEFFQY